MEEWTILVVDEEEADRAALGNCLLRDYRVITAGSVSELTGMDLFTRAQVSQPEAVHILIADDTNSRLLCWHSTDCETGAARRLTGQSDFHAKGDNRWQPPVRDSLCWPYGLAASGDTGLVCDSGNNRVLLWQLAQEAK